MSDPTPAPASARSRVRRLADRARYERADIHAILDEGFVCHVGFQVDGQPFVIPTVYARRGDEILLHGSAASRMLRTLGDGADCAIGVTHVDGLVLARSVFHHWGVTQTDDFGEIVFNLISADLLQKTADDRKEDFYSLFDFEAAFDVAFEKSLQSVDT